MVFVRSLTRRQAVKAGAVAAAAAGLRPAVPAAAARPQPVFELRLAGSAGARAASAGGWRTTKVFRAPRRFDLVGLVWERGSHAEAQLRARRRGGRWTRWVTLHPTGDHAPDGERGPTGTEPAFVGAADEFQLRLRGGPRDLRARFVRALPTARLATRLGRRGGRRARIAQAGSPPAIIPRADWGADSVPPRGAPQYGEVELAFVHHTVTANDYGPEDSAAIVLGIARYHRNSNGWNDIGYNFLVDKYGQVFEGRAGGIDQAVVGAQAQGYNSVSTGIACLGDFTAIAQTPEAMAVLARLIGWKLSLHAVPTRGTITVISAGGETNRYPIGTAVTFERISGHRDGNNTACPGNVLYGQLEQLRSAAAQFAGPTSGMSIYAPPEIRGVRPSEISGYLRFPDGSAAGGAAIAVEYLRTGSGAAAAWARVASAVAAADGTWEATVELPASGRVRAVFAGDRTRPRVESPPRKVTVLARLNITLDRTRLRLGRRVRVTGDADPATRVRLTLQLRSRRRWLTARRRLIRVRGGTYRAYMRPKGRGKYRISAQVGRIVRRRTIKVF